MRFSCIMTIVVLCLGAWSAQQQTARAQPYQKVWSGPSQRGSGVHQKQHAYAPGPICQQPCCPTCQGEQPKDADLKDALPEETRDAVPGIAPGVFVSPPQSGEIEGPSRGFEIGDISLTLPEIKLGLPRLRCVGIKHFSRDARMMTDRAAAPYVGNPYYATAMAQAQQQAANREAEPPEEEKQTKEAETTKDATKNACDSDLEQRIQRLEGSFQMQVQALQSCVEELRALRSAESAYQKSSMLAPPPTGTETRSDMRICPPRPLPPTAGVDYWTDAAQTNYEAAIPASVVPQPFPLRRLPATTQ